LRLTECLKPAYMVVRMKSQPGFIAHPGDS
jgi:hypothetical protein